MKQPNNTKTKIYSTALYMRLSRDDENFGDSVSIETQRTILQKFAPRTVCASMVSTWTMGGAAPILIAPAFSG